MNILQLNTSYSKGGAAQIARTIYKNLDKYKMFFAYGRGSKLKDIKAKRISYVTEIYLHGFLTRVFGIEGIGTYLSTKKLINFINKKKIDLINLHNIHGYYLNLNFIKYLKKNNIPVVWTFHDAWPFTGSCAFYFNCNRWKSGCGDCPNLETYPKNFFDQSNYMWSRKKEIFSDGWNPKIIVPSNWLKKEVNKSFLKEYNVEVINNGVDSNLFRPRNNKEIRVELNIPLDKKIILFVAADLEDKRKGIKYFFEAINYLKSKDYMVVTIGNKYKNQFNEIDIPIKQLGYIYDKEKLSEVYSMSDLFCITSLDDNFPTTVLESMSSGTPVVGFDVGGIPEQVSGNCGIVVESRNSKELSKKVEILLEDEKLNKEMSNNARQKSVNEYSVDRMINRYNQIYDKLLEV